MDPNDLDDVISHHIRRVLSGTKGKENASDGAAAIIGDGLGETCFAEYANILRSFFRMTERSNYLDAGR